MARAKISGIYKISNIINGKCYIGSSNNIFSRWTTHIRTFCRDMTGDKNNFWNKKHSQETKQKLREAHIGKKPSNSQTIIINGIEYKSNTDAAKSLGISRGTIYHRIKTGKYKLGVNNIDDKHNS